VPIVEQELLTLPEHQGLPPVLSGVRVNRSLDLFVSLFVLLYLFFWPLCCVRLRYIFKLFLECALSITTRCP